MSHISFKLISAVLIFFGLLSGCSGEKELLSSWTNQQIKVDGETSDWQNDLDYIKEYNVALGLQNDSKFLYICLTTNDFTKVLPMLRGGFITWIEPENDGKTIGIKYPMHSISNNNEQVPNSSEEIYNRRNPGEFINRMMQRQNELQVLNDDKLPLIDLPVENKEGITAKVGYNSDRFVYELKVPLNKNKYAYKISALPGEKIKIKFETEEPERKNFGGEREDGTRMSRGEGGEGTGFGAERPRGGRYGMRREGNSPFQPLNFSVEVTLKKD